MGIIISTVSIFILMIVIIIVILFFIFVTGKIEKHEATRSSYALGTLINLRANGNKAKMAIDKALERLNQIDDRMSAFKESSDISKINFNAGNKGKKVNNDTYFVVKKAIEYSKVLEGTFDPTIRPLVKLWSIGTKEEKVPEKSQIEKTLKLVNYNDVIFDDKNNSIMLKHDKQALDVGGIAKGFAADEVRDIFYQYNIKSALIDLGGNILLLEVRKTVQLGKLEFKTHLSLGENL
ncbi:thiamine biosynthesis lipoprotein [Clostridium beijerinckii]|nr:thiamine biosynthesis lipoprotein [Clostridium beijerinckii]NRT83321.1 thiamine biosynthesis lipoprotein [Clostridium beijerinckii]NYC66997.1 thiamine biosynthesis lipoprotein [Clostridium beijerinckii]NYC86916.1 thiamine biosynthesis lipoprotein [Clostridium beijerinckii]OOM46737.1 thiamine biosynthesis lipoprotein ApbE precursor [Clostridium beijerinckii]